MRLPGLYILIAIIICLCHGCGHDDSRLDYIYGLAEENPARALQLLDSLVDCSAVDTLDAYYTLTRIRVNDRNYIRHTSDERIMDVVKHYSDRPADPHYPEALYYAARVYSDIGDYPSSLIYFHKALDAVPDERGTALLRSSMLSQSGRLLNRLGLFQDADSCLMQALKINNAMGDSLNIMYNNQLLGIIRMNTKCYRDARKYFDISRRYASLLGLQDTTVNDIYIAEWYFFTQQLDSALMRIRPLPEQVDSDYRNYALAAAAEIYLANNKLDTARFYATQLIHSSDPQSKLTGYDVLTAPELEHTIPLDTLIGYVRDYRGLVKRRFDQLPDDRVLLQQSHYNYSEHDKVAVNAIHQAGFMEICLYGVFGILGLFGLYHIVSVSRKNREIKQLQTKHSNLDRLRGLTRPDAAVEGKGGSTAKQPDSEKSVPTEVSTSAERQDNEPQMHIPKGIKMNRDELLSEIRKEVVDLQKAAERYEISDVILNSAVHARMVEYMAINHCIPDEDPMWDEIENLVFSVSPYFQYHLQLLINSPLKTHHYHMFLLVKCGITPTGLTILLSRSKGTISNSRAKLAKSILGDKQSAQVMDLIIRML